jgi:hypothetical protein
MSEFLMALVLSGALVSAPAGRSEPLAKATGLGLNLPVVGRLIGGGNTLFATSIDVSNNAAQSTQVDFYFDAVDLVTQAPIVIDGSIANGGLTAQGGGTLRSYSNAHFDDFVNALVEASMLPAATRDHGVLGSLLLVFNGFDRRGQGSASARFYNELGGGTVGVALAAREVTTNEPTSLVATVRDTRGRPGPQLYSNMFINNMGLTSAGGAIAQPVTVEVSARANSSGQPVGVPILLSDIGPGQTASINQVLTALQVPASAEDTILVFARVTSGNAAIAGVISTVDAATRDGSLVEMSRADF